MKKKLVLPVLVGLLLAAAACAPTPTPTPAPTVTPRPPPPMAPTPDNLDLNEQIILKSDDQRIQNAEWKAVPNNASEASDLIRISFTAPDGANVRMYQRAEWTVFWDLRQADGSWGSNYGVEHVRGTLQDIKVGKGQGIGFDTIQLQIADDNIVIMHLIGRSWAMAFRRHEIFHWESALINWPNP